ncbi:hypothetical protein TWF694_011679 [Orbilia ellipsospora]|uniref:Peptidase metallopeptidase domain-containing protein n=1 Tax=Orbilia ellipsospora TaxID=2528407 RepID=A0AAV9X8K2_9PEZI
MNCIQLFEDRSAEGQYNHLVVERSLKWKTGEEITVSFIEPDPSTLREDQSLNPLTPRIKALIKHFAHQWEKFANIKFTFLEDGEMDALVRISLVKNGGSNSYVGTDCKGLNLNGRATMNFGWFYDDLDKTTDVSFRSTGMHEFGHALGCQHEQLNARLHWNENVVIEYYAKKENGGWSERKTRFNFNNFSPVQNGGQYATTSWDQESIMHYHIEKSWNKEGIAVRPTKTPSQLDKNFMEEMYPFSRPYGDKIMHWSSIAAVDVYEYQHAKMYISLFVQGHSGAIYQVRYLWRDGSPKIIENPKCQTTVVSTMAVRRTPLATLVHYDGPGVPTVHLFYLDKENSIQEIIWVNGERKEQHDLGIKATIDSDLSVVFWKENKDTPHFRLYLQDEDNNIQEYAKVGTSSWRKGTFLNFTKNPSSRPLSGTSLTFINTALDKPTIHGWWQCSISGDIWEATNNGSGWELNEVPRGNVPYHAAIAAGFKGKRAAPEIAVYNVTDSNGILKTDHGTTWGSEINGNTPVDEGTRMAVVDNDEGFHVFAIGGGHLIKRTFPKDGDAWADWKTSRVVMSDTSHLKN